MLTVFQISSQMENIGFFNEFMRVYGVQADYLFVTVDLYEKQNVPQVSSTGSFMLLVKNVFS